MEIHADELIIENRRRPTDQLSEVLAQVRHSRDDTPDQSSLTGDRSVAIHRTDIVSERPPTWGLPDVGQAASLERALGHFSDERTGF
jgi:hypothetical protein